MKVFFLYTLFFLGSINFCFGQLTSVTNKISVKAYDNRGLVEHLQLEGNEAALFDIPTYIQENSHLKRLIINGSISSDVSFTTIKFDSKYAQTQDGDYICEEVETTLKPFIGVKVSGRSDLNGVDIEKVIDAAPADDAGMATSESITEFDGQVINSTCDLISAVQDSEIGNQVELTLTEGFNEYSKSVVIGYREVNTITYKYCRENPAETNFDVNTEEASLTSYPNPTSSVSYVSFKSTSDEDITFSVIDIKGSLVHREIFSDFDGNLRLDYKHNTDSAGTYVFVIQQGDKTYKELVHFIK